MPDAQKRKKPPTFQHYPANRAKRLKKEWVERAKIKSRWKAQKRRENITTLRSGNLSPPPPLAGAHLSDDGDEDDRDRGSPSPSRRLASESPSRDRPEKPHSDSGSEDNADGAGNGAMLTPPSHSLPRQQRQYHDKKSYPTSQDRINSGDVGKNDDKASLRHLFQKAYSKSSLHTYKSDPLKKGRNVHVHAQGHRGRGSSRGAAPGGSGRGQGQPNMKLRMNAILEKIKQDYT